MTGASRDLKSGNRAEGAGLLPLTREEKGAKVENYPCCTAFDLPVSEPHAYHLALIAPGADRMYWLFFFIRQMCLLTERVWRVW